MGAASHIYLVRHAKAGDRSAWNGDDAERPLSHAGERQAKAIGARLAKRGATILYSSPYARCVGTLQPLAAELGTEVRVEQRLHEGTPFEQVLELIAEVEHGAVLCTHGDVIGEVIAALQRRGMELDTPLEWRKGSVWVLRRKRDRVTRGKVWPPPST
jgi:8-oxo-dGTP diphosphatase